MKKPGIPVTVWALALVAVLGLVTQYLAAEHAFSLIGRTELYSIAAALLIETAIVVDAVVVSKNRNYIAAASLLVALGVSGIYNYTLADMSSAELELWQKAALAIGPLVALTTIALALGEELYKWEQAVHGWALDQQLVQDEQDQEQAHAVREQARAVTAQRMAARTAAQDREQWDRSLEQQKLDAELHEDKLARRRAERWERKQAVVVAQPLAPEADVQYAYSGPGPDNGREHSALDQLLSLNPYALNSRASFVQAYTQHNSLLSGIITPKALAERTGLTTRTARRWVSDARKKGALHGTN